MPTTGKLVKLGAEMRHKRILRSRSIADLPGKIFFVLILKQKVDGIDMYLDLYASKCPLRSIK